MRAVRQLGYRLRNFERKFSERFLSMVERRRFTVYSTPTAELKQILDGFGAIYLDRLATC
jgi:hypothetical protein